MEYDFHCIHYYFSILVLNLEILKILNVSWLSFLIEMII